MAKKGDGKSVRKQIPEELQELEQELITVNPKVFEGVSSKKKEEILNSFTMQVQKMHSGPLPDPETLIQYNSVIPNGADRIMIMAEKQQEHRISIEKTIIKSQSNQSRLGQIFGLIMGLVGIGSGTYLASIGSTTVGGIIAGTTVVSLVSVFVIGKRMQQKSLKD